MNSGRPHSNASRPRVAHAVPRAEILFEPVRDRHGWRLALVFGNHAPGGFCPYYTEERCFHCDIGAGEGAAFELTANRQRLAWFQEYYRPHLASISHLVLYNSGSVLNPREMPPEMLDEIVIFACSLPAVRVLSLDSREPFIKPDILERILSVAGPACTIRPILGIESGDDRIRDDILRKGMPRQAINRVFNDLSRLEAEFGPSRIGLDVNIVIAGPGTTCASAVDDAVLTARDVLISGADHGVKVDLNLHPYYPSSRGYARFSDHPRCSTAVTARAAARIAELVRSMAADSCLFIGWNDEGHDREREQRDVEIEQARAALDHFNRTNDPDALSGLEPSREPGAPGLRQAKWPVPDQEHGPK